MLAAPLYLTIVERGGLTTKEGEALAAEGETPGNKVEGDSDAGKVVGGPRKKTALHSIRLFPPKLHLLLILHAFIPHLPTLPLYPSNYS